MLELRDVLLAACVTGWITIVIRSLLGRLRGRTPLPYPPGPTGRFLVGNLFDIPKERPYLQYAKWAKEYNSDVISLHVPGMHTIVVNSAKAAKALFEQRSAIYSDKPHLEMFPLMGLDFNFAFMPYGDAWRGHRRIVQQWFRPDAMPTYHQLLVSRLGPVLNKVLQNPEGGVDLFKDSIGAFPLVTLYGRDADLHQDPLVKATENLMHMMGYVMFPGTSIVNTFPFLKHLPSWVPGMKWTWSMIRKCKPLTDSVQYSPFNDVKKRLNVEGSPESRSILASMLRQNERDGKGEYGEWIVRRVAATLNVASADTSMSSISGAVLALVTHPHIQARAQAELDMVVGRDRLPNFSDRDQLPYISAIAKETLRWQVITPLAVSHACTQDDIYEGMFIPKGSIVTGNSWAILHDPEAYPEPDRFLPERFIASDGSLIRDDVAAAFGFGRRICPGRYFAYDVLWIAVASMLSVFDIKKAKDKEGNEIDVKVEYADVGVSHPLPFQCVMRPRDSQAVSLIKSKANTQIDHGQL